MGKKSNASSVHLPIQCRGTDYKGNAVFNEPQDPVEAGLVITKFDGHKDISYISLDVNCKYNTGGHGGRCKASHPDVDKIGEYGIPCIYACDIPHSMENERRKDLVDSFTALMKTNVELTVNLIKGIKEPNKATLGLILARFERNLDSAYKVISLEGAEGYIEGIRNTLLSHHDEFIIDNTGYQAGLKYSIAKGMDPKDVDKLVEKLRKLK